MPPFRRLAVVLAPAAAVHTLLDHADMLARLWTAPMFCLVAPEDVEILGPLPAALTAARDEGRATIRHVRGPLLDSVLHEIVGFHADLLLVGSGRRGEDRRSLVRRLAMQAPCSVWMVPAGAGASICGMLVPVDFSPRSADALSVATAIAATSGAGCAVLHVRFDATLAAPEEAVSAVVGREHEAFSILTARTDLHGVEVEGLFEDGGDVAKVVLRVAEDRQADLTVMGTRGRTRAAALLIGSETEHVLQESERPVLAVKHFGAHLRLTEALLDPRFRSREGPRFG